MRSSTAVIHWGLLIYTLVQCAQADVLATILPCPDCPSSIQLSPITVTAQYQPVSTCLPEEVCTVTATNTSCHLAPTCLTYDFVSTTIPVLQGAASAIVTATNDIIPLYHLSTVSTSFLPCATTTLSLNSTTSTFHNASCSSAIPHTTVVDISAPFNELGPLAEVGYDGSGLCDSCVPNADTTIQVVDVTSCVDQSCSIYAETWVKSSTTASSTSAATISSQFTATAGVNTITVTKTFYPPGNPAITGNPAVGGDPAITAVNPVNGGVPGASLISYGSAVYTEPVTTSAVYVTSCPGYQVIDVTLTFSVVYTAVYGIPPQTVVSGSTVTPTMPASNSATPTSTPGTGTSVVLTTSTIFTTQTLTTVVSSGTLTSTVLTTTTISVTETIFPVSSTTTSTTSTALPTDPPFVGLWEFLGCSASRDNYPTFELVLSSGAMTLEICTNECQALGTHYAGLYLANCYCAQALDAFTGPEFSDRQCHLPCPGNSTEACGEDPFPAVQKREITIDILLSIYVYIGPPYTTGTPTPTTTPSRTSTTSSQTSDVSSDPDPEPEKRNIHADMEYNPRKFRRSAGLRRGGMLQSPNKHVKKTVNKKRDFAVKQLFGL